MKITNNIFITILLCLSFAPVTPVSAMPNLDNLTYPIAELGQCSNREECEKYCADGTNMVSCISYAEKNNLLSAEDLKISKLVAEKIAKGETPGSCKTKEECEAFCKGKVENMDQCLAFGESIGAIPAGELEQAKKILKALKDGANMPGGCTTKDSCELYCKGTEHIDECLAFAEKANILPKEELEEAKKVAQFLKNGTTPGGCKNKEDCKVYCNDSSHWDECLSFAQQAGFITAKEAEIAKKSGGSGPGGCKSEQECEAYCNDASHYDECVKFGIEKDILTTEEKDLIQNGLGKMEAALNNFPSDIKAETIACLEKSIGTEKLAKIRSNQEPITKDVGSKIESCFAVAASKMQARAMESMPSGGGAPANIPTAPTNIPTAPSGGGMPPAGSLVPDISCSNFTAVPSCDMVPAGVARDACNKCK